MNQKIRFGVIGAGRMGTNHARILGKHPDIDLVGVSDTNVWRAQIAAWRGGAAAYPDYKDFLPKVDAVIVAVPTQHHLEVGLACLNAGVHCLIEKPLAASVDEARQLLVCAEKNQVQLQVGHVERFNPAVLQAIEHIRHPRFITVERLGPYDPRMKDIGVVLDLMIHDIDILLTLVGSEVESLEALGASLFSKHEDIANVRIRFKSGCVADLTASRISLKRCRKIRIFQESSYISLDYRAQEGLIYRIARDDEEESSLLKKLLASRDSTIVSEFAGKRIVREPVPIAREEPLKLELSHFINCIREKQTPMVSGESARRALDLAFEITRQIQATA